MIRVSKLMGYLLLSSNQLLTAKQDPMKYKPFIIEPPKQFFVDPVAIFDFQSLYPSIMISHNICYSTCLGVLGAEVKPTGEKKIGFTSNYLSIDYLSNEDFIITANDAIFVSPKVRKGMLPKILEEFLMTRIMLKTAIKDLKGKFRDKAENQQKSLKLFMNTTFGYTGAGFSGRMPMVELADAVVATARRVVHQTIQIIESINPKLKVIYGDTDSVFVLMKGMGKKQCFSTAKLIIDRITTALPHPVELKFEKLYQPCMLYSKKRYCGFKLETPLSDPVIDAKGIEIVRRDQCGLIQKLMFDLSLSLFQNRSLGLARQKLESLLKNCQNGRFDMHDFIIQKKFKHKLYKNNTPQLMIVDRRISKDPMNFPLHGERIKFFIVEGDSNTKLFDMVS